jgi:hypothetical protein
LTPDGGLTKDEGSWRLGDLAVIGVLAALARVLGLFSVFALGGMNPLSLTVRAALTTLLWIVLKRKVRRFGTLVLATLTGSMVSFLVMAQGLATLPLTLAAAFLAELLIDGPGRGRNWAVIAGTAWLGVLDKVASLGVLWLTLRERPAMLWPLFFMIAVSALGDALACLFAPRFLRELEHAGFIKA